MNAFPAHCLRKLVRHVSITWNKMYQTTQLSDCDIRGIWAMICKHITECQH